MVDPRERALPAMGLERRRFLGASAAVVTLAVAGGCGIGRTHAGAPGVPESEKVCGLRVDEGVFSVAIPQCDGPIWWAATRPDAESATQHIANTWSGGFPERPVPVVATLDATYFAHCEGSYSTTDRQWVEVRSERVGRVLWWPGFERQTFPEQPDTYVNSAGARHTLERIRKEQYTCYADSGSLFS